MPEETKPTQIKEPRMVPESQIIAYKKGAEAREKRLEAELANLKSANTRLESELEIAKLSEGDDEDIKAVKAGLTKRDKELTSREDEHKKELAAIEKRERAARVKELVIQYGVDEESISGEDDPEKAALKLVTERLTKEAKERKDAPPPVYENENISSTKKMPNEMTKEEFATHLSELKRKAALS